MNEPTPSPLRPEYFQQLVRRHEAGERTPALLDALNHAAFQCFHAPWECEPLLQRLRSIPMGESAATRCDELDGLDLDCSGPEVDEPMEEVAVVSPEMKALLCQICALGHRVFVDGLLSLRAEIAYDPVADCHATVAFDLDFSNDLIQVRTWSDLRDDTWDPVRAGHLCVQWNRKMPRLKAGLRTPKQGLEGAGERLFAETHLTLSHAMTDTASFVATLGQVLKNCRDLWRFTRRGLRRPR